MLLRHEVGDGIRMNLTFPLIVVTTKMICRTDKESMGGTSQGRIVRKSPNDESRERINSCTCSRSKKLNL